MQRVTDTFTRVYSYLMPRPQPLVASYARAAARQRRTDDDDASSDEQTPLLAPPDRDDTLTPAVQQTLHGQFAALIGLAEHGDDVAATASTLRPGAATLYTRARKKHARQACNYWITSTLNNTLLLAQVVIGASLTALGALGHSQTTIVVFGVLNTIIASVVAYMKSRGQPMRARMYRDDLERVLNEIENSEIMWAGISSGAHGYQEIDLEAAVSVRSEVARLTRLYDRAVRNNTLNNPDLYQLPGGHESGGGLRERQAPQMVLPVVGGAPAVEAPAAAKPADDAEPAPSTSPPAKKDGAAKDADPAAQPAPATTVPVPAAPPAHGGSVGMPLTTDVDEGPVTLVKIKSVDAEAESGAAADASVAADKGKERSGQ